MLDIHRLRIFVKVADLKSFSRAAETLYLTQPTVSQHMAALEAYLELQLFDRCGKEIRLTRAGEILYGYARRVADMADEAEQALDDFKGRKSGHITVGASTIPGEFILPALLGGFNARFPGVKTILRVGDTSDIVAQLLQRDIEVGVVGAQIKHAQLTFTRFLDDELVIAVPRGHRWCARHDVSLEELLQEPFVMRESGSGTRIALGKRLNDAGISPDRLNIAAEVGSTTAVKEAVKAGLGVSFMSERALADDLRMGTMHTLRLAGIDFPRTFYVVQERKRSASPLCTAFVQYLLQPQERP